MAFRSWEATAAGETGVKFLVSRRFAAVVSLPLLAALLLNAEVAIPAEPDGAEFFRDRIEPVLQAQCYQCHSADADDVQAGLLLDSRNGILQGGDSGPVVDLESVESSLLLSAIRHEDGLEMPPDGPPLTPPVIADFVRWIEIGAPHPNEASTDVIDERYAAARDHWAFQPVQKPSVPAVHSSDWIATPVDAFVLAALEERGWRPAPAATRVELIRRVTFDLTGLPPTPEAIDAFVSDESPLAYEKLVDRLLSSPQYGERWAQHWLDVVRYAESEGFEYDRHLPDAWRYRDYVIDSLNRDKPYDQFVTEQLAGDEIDSENLEYQTATVFHRLGPVRRNAGNPEIAFSRNEVLTERTNIIGEAFLGLTVGCARCHNHKLEPISQKDYYRLQAYVAATEEHNLVLETTEETAAREAETSEIEDEISKLNDRIACAPEEEKGPLRAKIASL